MPLYFFLSGLFFKEYEGFWGFFLRKVNKLLIPFAFFYLVTSFALPNILNLCGYTINHKQSLGISGLWAFITKENFGNNPLWFLWALFLVNIYFYAILVPVKRLIGNSTYVALIVTIISFAIGFLSSGYLSNNYNLPGFADSAMSALPFFSMGYLFNNHTNILIPNRWDKFLPITIVVCFAVTFLVDGKLCGYMLNHFPIHPILLYVYGMAGTIGITFLSKLLRNLPFVTNWGRYSLMILCTHGLLLEVFMPLSRLVALPKSLMMVVVLAIVMFSYELLIPLMKKYLPYVTGQKDVIDVSKHIQRK